jgi:hypothetical protein
MCQPNQLICICVWLAVAPVLCLAGDVLALLVPLRRHCLCEPSRRRAIASWAPCFPSRRPALTLPRRACPASRRSDADNWKSEGQVLFPNCFFNPVLLNKECVSGKNMMAEWVMLTRYFDICRVSKGDLMFFLKRCSGYFKWSSPWWCCGSHL